MTESDIQLSEKDEESKESSDDEKDSDSDFIDQMSARNINFEDLDQRHKGYDINLVG